MILLNLNINQETLLFLPYSGFTYKSILSLQNYTQPTAYSEDFEFSYNDTIITITTVRVGAIIYDQKDIDSMIINIQKSFFDQFVSKLIVTTSYSKCLLYTS